jgi:hypothetical protein
VIAATALVAAMPDALGAGPRLATGAGGADGRDDAAKAAGIRVSNIAIAPVTGLKSAPPAGLPTDGLGRLLAHLRRPATAPFSMLGVTWQHDGTVRPVTVEVRTKSGGAWSRWTELDTDADGGPITAGGDSSFRDGTEPEWAGKSTGVEVAVFGEGPAPRGLEVSTIDPGASPAGLVAASADTKAGQITGKPGSFPRIPTIVTRKQWGADESLGDECWDPKYGHTFKAAIVHHTAGSNDYTRAESAAIVRGVYAYHTQSRGWCDIGYNFLIDRFGTVYEGRDGGIRRPVRGAHSGDYNVNTTGISLMGNFDLVQPTAAMRQSLISLIAWRLGTAYHRAYGRPFVFDHRISRVSGHRDVMSTACPGQHVYDWLPRLRVLVNQRLGSWASPIERSWERSGGKNSELGAVKMGEVRASGGHRTVFVHGRMYDSGHGMHTVYAGPILDKYIASGDVKGDLGYPTTNLRKVGDGPGRAVFFDGGRIYWSKRTGAQVLRSGAILHKYRMLKGAVGALGLPRTGVVDRQAFAVARFQGGSIRLDRQTHTVSVEYR